MGTMVYNQEKKSWGVCMTFQGNYQNLSPYFSSFSLTSQKPPLLPLPFPKPPPKSKSSIRPSSPRVSTPKRSKSSALTPSPAQSAHKRVIHTDTGKRIPSKLFRPVSEKATAMEDYSGSIFLVSPHPSSLPLPRFSLPARAKVSAGRCKTEAAAEGVDTGAATDSLRRLLQLR